MEKKMYIQDEFIPYLISNNIRYKLTQTPRGATLILDIAYNGKTSLVKIFMRDDYCDSIEISSSQPVDPDQYYQVRALLGYHFKRRGSSYDWRLMDDGFYCIEPIRFYGLGEPDEDITDIMQMLKLFSICEPFIEEVAHGQKTIEEVLPSLIKLKMVRK